MTTECMAVSDAGLEAAKHINVFTAVKPKPTDGNTRKLTFLSNDLGKNINLLLMFTPPPKSGKLFVDLFPVCWKVLSFSASGTVSATVVYTDESAFLVPQVNSGNLVTASTAQPCETGKKCTLKTNEWQINYLTEAVSGTPKLIQCFNETGRRGDIGIGFYNFEGTKVDPVFLWNNVATLSVDLAPILLIYVVSNFKETELIREEIQSPILWERDLISLKPSTQLNVSIDKNTGSVIIG